MTKIDLNRPIIGLDGQQLVNSPNDPTPAVLGKVIATALSQSTSEHPVKVLSWCMKLFSGEVIELTPDDVSILLSLVQKLPVQDLLKAQVLNTINQSVLNDSI